MFEVTKVPVQCIMFVVNKNKARHRSSHWLLWRSMIYAAQSIGRTGWHVTAENVVVPVWISWIGLALAGYLAYQGFRSSRS
jgi:hypothetical protein